MMQLADLKAGYGSTPVLQGVDLRLGDGERTAVLGRNGVGKTTLMRAISGLVPLSGGVLRFDGESIGHLKTHERARLGISLVPQGRDIFPKLTVVENLKVAAAIHRGPKARHMNEIFEEFPVLADKREARGGSLSGGQQQILALARALLTNPKVLLLDEPSEGIQPSILDEIVEVIDKINTERGIAVLLVEQNLDFAVRIAQRGLIMEKGEFVQELNIAELGKNRDLHRKYMAL